MKDKAVIDELKKDIEPIVEDKGLELVDIEYLFERGEWVLRLIIDKPGGVTLKDCTIVNQKVSDLLDLKDPFSHSPGLTRSLKKEDDFRRYVGRRIKLTTRIPLENRKNFKGIICDFSDGNVLLETQDGKQVAIPFKEILKANLIFDIKEYFAGKKT